MSDVLTITAFFTNAGAPQEGLGPVIKIRDVDTTLLLVSESLMTEIGDGWYKFLFSGSQGYDVTGSYTFRCDGGSTITNNGERYTWGSNEIEDNVYNKSDRSQFASGTFGEAIQLIGNVEGGNWIIDGTKQTFFDRVASGSTVLEFELQDDTGTPTTDAPFRRIKLT